MTGESGWPVNACSNTSISRTRLHLMRMLLLLSLLWIASCSKPVTSDGLAGRQVSGDKNPVVAALDHFRGRSDLWLAKDAMAKSVLLVDRHYETSKGFISASQLRMDLSGDDWTVPEDARLDIERRVNAGETFPATRFPSYLRKVNLGERPPGNFKRFAEAYPDARCHIRLWPPGYTKDRRHAVVRFLFGPTPHGASAVYLLELRDGLWHVVQYDLSYYA